MLEDIVKVTTIVFAEALEHDKNLNSPINVYNVYRNLSEVIGCVKLVANHYLALDLSEDFLQNSSFGEPVDKWRRFFNEDLSTLNNSLKRYLHSISSLCFEDEHEGILSKYYRCKSYYSFVEDEYNIGFVEACGSMLYVTSLDTTLKDPNHHLACFAKIDLTTFESKKELQSELLLKAKELEAELVKLKAYMQERYTLQDLL